MCGRLSDAIPCCFDVFEKLSLKPVPTIIISPNYYYLTQRFVFVVMCFIVACRDAIFPLHSGKPSQTAL